MSSAPETDADLTVTVKRVPGGLVSNWLHDHVSEGDVLDSTKPAGVFCVHDGDRRIVAFCGGSGVTPVMSITRACSPARAGRSDFYGNRDERPVIFHDQLRGRRAPRPTRRPPPPRRCRRLPGRRRHPAVRRRNLDADFYVCGPGPFMDLVETTLLERGRPRPDLHRALRQRGPSAPSGRCRGRVGVSGEGEAPDDVTVILKGKRQRISYRSGDTLLETVRRAGYRRPSPANPGTAPPAWPCSRRLRHHASQPRADRRTRSPRAGSSPARVSPTERTSPSNTSPSAAAAPAGLDDRRRLGAAQPPGGV